MSPDFLATSLLRRRRTREGSGLSTEEPPWGQQRKVLPLGLANPGFWARSVSTNIKDSQDRSGRAKPITANAGEKNRPAAGTQSSFCYRRTRLVTVFSITDLASTQEEHTIQLPHASADQERKERKE